MPTAIAKAVQAETVYVNTSRDIEPEPDHCDPEDEASLCPLRSALLRLGDEGGTLRARYCGGDPSSESGPCLGPDDPGFDAATNRFHLDIALGYGHTITATAPTIDFAAGVEGWAGPEDNRIVLGAGPDGVDTVLAIESAGGHYLGFDVRGEVSVAGIALQVDATDNRLEGLSIRDVRPAASASETAVAGILMRGSRITGNSIGGSWCGLAPDGKSAAAIAGACIALTRGAHDNAVGGAASGDGDGGNHVCSSSVGVLVEGDGSRANAVIRNSFGSGLDGRSACPNSTAISVGTGAHDTRIENNVISASSGDGIAISGDVIDTLVAENLVGTDIAGSSPLPNAGFGLSISGSVKRTDIERNVFAFNGGGGVRIAGSRSLQNTLTRNLFFGHEGKPVEVSPRSNGGIRPPTLTGVGETEIIGIGCPNCRIDFFSDDDDEAMAFEGSIETLSSSPFIFEKPEGFIHSAITAMATNLELGSSELSPPQRIGPPLTAPSPTPLRIPSATPTPTSRATLDPALVVGRAFLPWSRTGQRP